MPTIRKRSTHFEPADVTIERIADLLDFDLLPPLAPTRVPASGFEVTR